eukprot:2243376-Prymnesium_polylepis.1
MSQAKCCAVWPITDGRQSARKSRSRAATRALMLPCPSEKRVPRTWTAGLPSISNHGLNGAPAASRAAGDGSERDAGVSESVGGAGESDGGSCGRRRGDPSDAGLRSISRI